MKRFQRQLWFGLFWLVGFSALALGVHARYAAALPNYAYLTGWALFAVMVLLTVYNIRKKLPFLPLGTSERWLQVHIYAGFFTTLLFLMHLKFRLPTGWFEGTLAVLFLVVTVSGIGGLFLTRSLPRRLSTHGGEVIYEKIAAVRHSLREQAEALVLAGKTQSPALAELYVRRLAAFFTGPRNFWHHLFESRRPLNELTAELDDMRRFIKEEESGTLVKLTELVRQKDGLDYHQALQSALKLWLFIHIPFTYSLMLFTLVHIVLVFAFSGGAR